ncbi:hypothetical protein N7532_001050 [Penicillium argentinense]|uniref:Uncharacterized protein n=1 Tax=Penicillium argentinense TaxID=1131581 RepID=A0A9W9G1S8_9EURO|nr:uncharacterized protein N7532_001050 [Penicillium argentinense]KAJ5110515.1 hypothetical protein N7532_001050 [Penicillium argentinense]
MSYVVFTIVDSKLLAVTKSQGIFTPGLTGSRKTSDRSDPGSPVDVFSGPLAVGVVMSCTSIPQEVL